MAKVDLEKALAQVPLIDPEHKPKVIEKIAKACDVGGQRARNILDQLIIDGKGCVTAVSMSTKALERL